MFAIERQQRILEILKIAGAVSVSKLSEEFHVAEETVRLRSHFEQLNKFMDSDVAVGRKIDFII